VGSLLHAGQDASCHCDKEGTASGVSTLPKAAKGIEVVAGDDGMVRRNAMNELTVGMIRQMEQIEVRPQFA
jgi:hypothetical protein